MNRFMTRFLNYFQSSSNRKYSSVGIHLIQQLYAIEQFFILVLSERFGELIADEDFLSGPSNQQHLESHYMLGTFPIPRSALNRKRDIGGQTIHFLNHYQRFYFEWESIGRTT